MIDPGNLSSSRNPAVMSKLNLPTTRKSFVGTRSRLFNPKDEFELVKSKQKQSEVVDGKVNGHGPDHQPVSVSNQPVNVSNQPVSVSSQPSKRAQEQGTEVRLNQSRW